MTAESDVPMRSEAGEPSVPFDGIICFGGVDWWYHNRGHYDLQMMRELSRDVPVLYINSIGMRAPKLREGAMFVKRVIRKLRSIGNGLVSVRPNFHVLSPITLPGTASSGAVMNRLLALQVLRAARRCGIRNPLLWIACPPAASLIDAFDPVAVVYQRTDRFESFHGVDAEKIAAFDRALKQRSDLVLFCARTLHEAERDDCRSAAYVDHGVDFEHFRDAGISFELHGTEPVDMRGIAHPRVGFIGGIDAHTFDPELFLDVARRLPDHQFVLVGACSLPEDWCDLANVHLLGQRPYAAVATYMAACDVLIMPWNQNEWIAACNPVKLKEYLAVGRPVVSTPFAELDGYSAEVITASSGRDFADAIRQAMNTSVDAQRQRLRVECQGWQVKADLVRQALRAGQPARSPAVSLESEEPS